MKTKTLILLRKNLKKFEVNFALILLLFTCTTIGFSQKTSTGSGAWNVAGTWTPAGVPTGTDQVIIAAGHTVSIPANATCRNITINGTLNLTGTNITLDITNNSSASPTNGITLGSGSSLLIGSTNTVYFSNGQASGIVNNGGTIVNTGLNGVDGGTIRANTCCGGEFRISGSGSTVVYNLDFLNNANFNLQSPLLINGTVSMDDNNWNSSSSNQSPVYGPGSTLSINWNNQGITASGSSPLNNNLARMWSTSTGTIGITQGYPNNVTIMNVGTSNGGVNIPPTINVGWRPNVAIGLNGTLSIGNGTVTGVVSLDQAPSVNCGGITVNNGSTLIGPPTASPFTNRGNFTLAGATTGLWYERGATINFAGNGTIGSPQTISTTAAGGSITFPNMTITNGTYVRLDDPVNVTNTLTLTSGFVGTSTTNPLTITNTANTAIVGGSSTAYINGPLRWNLPGTPTGNYVFPIGDLVNNGGAYLPLTLQSANTAGGTTVTATAFQLNAGGTPDTTINTISTTEYWSISSTNPFIAGPRISVTRPNAVAPYNALGKSTSSNGIYTAIGGTASGNSINGGGFGTTNPVFITMVNAFLNVVKVGGTNAGVDSNCNPTTGSLIVGGVGGSPPYTFSVDGSPFTSTTTYSPLAKGPHIVRIRDNNSIERTSILYVLGALQINGDDANITICPPASATLNATNLQNASPTYTWAPGGQTTPSITVNPVANTTYTVTSTVYATNLISNGSFESGNPTGFSAGYTLYVGGAYNTTPGSGGLYTVSNSGTNQCVFFTSLAAQDGTNYFIGDASTSASNVFTLSIPALTGGTVYRLSYWYAKGSNDTNPTLATIINGSTIGSVNVTDYLAWTQVNYSFTAIAGTNTITIRATNNPGTTNGNDFYIDNIQLLAPCTINTSVQVLIDCTLPVDLLTFEVKKQNNGAQLSWLTTNEKNNDYFIVEKSLDGINFYPIGYVDAKGHTLNGNSSYGFFDPTLVAGVNYYRLVQYDTNGSNFTSEIKSVTYQTSLAFVIAPNPNHGVFEITYHSFTSEIPQVLIYNAIGQLVFEKNSLPLTSGSITILDMAPGMYIIEFLTSQEKLIQKVLVE